MDIQKIKYHTRGCSSTDYNARRRAFANIYRLVVAMHTHPRLYKWLKTEYSDICSKGDCIINSMLDGIYFDKGKNILDIAKEDPYLVNTYLVNRYVRGFLRGRAPDPWWAS